MVPIGFTYNNIKKSLTFYAFKVIQKLLLNRLKAGFEF